MELRAHASYAPKGSGLPVAYWRTASGIEVDFILGNAEVAIEVKSTDRPTSDQLKGLRPRRSEDGIELLPWRDFLRQLWRHEINAA